MTNDQLANNQLITNYSMANWELGFGDLLGFGNWELEIKRKTFK
jgi:hypothetical protein